jgi:hypothetical protein
MMLLLLYGVENSYVNARMPEKSYSGINIFTGSQLIQSASAFQHQAQSGTTGHGLVWHCPAMSRVFTKVTFGISRKSKFYLKMVLISRNFEYFHRARMSLQGYRVRLHGSKISLHESKVSLHGPRVILHEPRLSMKIFRVNMQGSRMSLHGTRMSLQGSRVSLQGSRVSLNG